MATLNNAPLPTPGDEKAFADDQVEHADIDAVKDNSGSTDAVIRPESLRGLSDEEIKRLDRRMVRKLDFVIMPIMGILYIMNYVDRSALAATKVYGIMEDLNMNNAQFATAISILFVGYIPFQLPSNMILTRISRPGLYLCLAAVVWGVVSTLTAVVKNYTGLLVQRVFLGVTEAVFFPGILYYLSAWYTKNELGKRYAALFMFQMLGSAFGGFVAAACLTLDGRYGIRGWRWLFIVEGVLTIGFGIVFAFIMPEFPQNARLLKPIERDYAVWRLQCEAGDGEAHEETTAWEGFKLAARDPKVWALIFCGHMAQAMGSIVNFFPSIVQTLGYGKTETLLLTAPPYILAAGWFYLISLYSDRTNKIYIVIVTCLGMAFVAYITALSTLVTGARYFAMMLMPSACSGPQIMMYKTMSIHQTRPFTKRAIAVAALNAIGGIANIWTSYLYYAPPHYYAAFGTLLAAATMFALVITGYKFYVRRLNKMLDGSLEQQQKVIKAGVTQQQVDMGWRFTGY